MSYAFTVPLRGLGIPISASVTTAVDVKTGASVSQTTQDAAKAADVQLPDCSSAAITGNSYVDSTFVRCCQDIKKMTGSAADKAKGIGQCAARGAATGACMAGGVVTFGISTALAPLCGTLGAAIFDRAMGWNAAQWVGAGIGGGICSAISGGIAGPLCAYAAAELVGWVCDTLGPLIDDIFNPSAAKDRELAARAASHALTAANEDLMIQADAAVRRLWSNSIKSIKEVYKGSVGLLPGSYQAKAQQILGFAPNYGGVAAALVAAGVPATPLDWLVGPGGNTVSGRMRATRSVNGGRGCESTAEGCLGDGYSEVCPFSFSDFYSTMYYSRGMDKLTGDTRARMLDFETQTLATMQALANSMLPAMQQAIAVVATKVAITVTGLKQQALLEEAKAKDTAKFVATAVQAAKAAEAAAESAKSWSGNTRKKAITKAQNEYEIVKQTRAVLTFAAAPGSVPLSATYQKKLADATTRSIAAVKASQSNAHTAELLIGATATAGVVGIGYLLLRRAR